MMVEKTTFYALKNKGLIVYVGRTNNITRRMYQHKSENEKVYDSYKILKEIECDQYKAMRVEDLLIKKHNPVYNRALNSIGHYVSFEDALNDVGKENELLLDWWLGEIKAIPIFGENYKYYLMDIAIKQVKEDVENG